jgi:hypothetical protein
MPDDAKPALPDRALPTAVAIVALGRARAILLSAAQRDDTAARQRVLPVDDLVYQSRLLIGIFDAHDTDPHPWLIWRLAHAAAVCSLVEQSPKSLTEETAGLQRIARRITEGLLADNVLDRSRPLTGVALAFCAATLALPPNPDRRYVDAALEAASEAQRGTGSWAEGRTVHGHRDPDTGALTMLSSHEVSLAMVTALGWSLVADPNATVSTPIVSAIQRSIDHAASSRLDLGEGRAGWASEPSFARRVVDTDATAAVLGLVVNARRVAASESAALALAQFDLVWRPNRDPTAPYLKWDDYREKNEPDAKNPILPLLHEKFVEPVQEHKRRDRRPWAPEPGRSLLLFGPPGTTKTTIVKSMAEGLGWPLVILSPGTFIRDGLEHVERRAIEVFKLLEQLSAVVVLFDECDELFRSRDHDSQADNDQLRSISAFMTASMLPKLQDLRDRERVVFVIATNYFDQIDAAAKRIGRIDHIVGVSWPDETQRRSMIEHSLKGDKQFAELDEAIRELAVDGLARKTRWCIRGDIVQMGSKLGQRSKDLDDPGKAPEIVSAIVATATKISENHRKRFVDDAAQSSEAHEARRGELEAE